MKKKTITILSVLFSVGLLVGSIYAAHKLSSNVVGNENCVSTSSPTVKECKISITHAGGYSPDSFVVNRGDTVRFLANTVEPAHMHGITIDEYEVDEAIDAGPKDPPQVIEFNASKTGTFTIWCKPCLVGPYGDHQWMKGKLIVR